MNKGRKRIFIGMISVFLIIVIAMGITCAVLFAPRKINVWLKNDEKILSISISYPYNAGKQGVYVLETSRYNEFIKEAGEIKFQYWYNLKRVRLYRTTEKARYKIEYENHTVLFDEYHYYAFDADGNLLKDKNITIIDKDAYVNLEKFFA